MNKLARINSNKRQRAARSRAKIHGSSERPRLSVFISNTNVSAQVIDDDKSITIVSATTVGDSKLKGSLSEKAAVIGEQIATACAKQKVSKVVLDRGNKKYHGRVAALADAARAKGLEF